MPYQPPSGASCFTDWRPNCVTIDSYKKKFDIKDNGHVLRQTFQNEALKLIQNSRETVYCLSKSNN